MTNNMVCVEYSLHGLQFITDNELCSLQEAEERIEKWKHETQWYGGDARVKQ